jgi:hypothetical protein
LQLRIAQLLEQRIGQRDCGRDVTHAARILSVAAVEGLDRGWANRETGFIGLSVKIYPTAVSNSRATN